MKRNVITVLAVIMICATAFGQEKENATAGKTGLTVFERVPLNGAGALKSDASIDFLPMYMGFNCAVTAEGIRFGKFQLGSVRFSHDETHRSEGYGYSHGRHTSEYTYVGIDLMQVCWDKGPAWHRESLTFGLYAEFLHADGRPTHRYLGVHSAYRVGCLSANLDLTADKRSKAYLMLTLPIGSMARVRK